MRWLYRARAVVRWWSWWDHILPPVLWIALLGFLYEPRSLALGSATFGWFCLSFVGIAGFGFLLNDIFDIEVDAQAGKSNAAASLRPPVRWALIACLLTAGIIPWLFLPRNVFNLSGLSVQVLLLVIYAAPPLRLKDRGFAGAMADALYGHVVPAWIAAFTFMSPSRIIHHWLLWSFAAAWLMAHGLRNILLHQLDDRHADRFGGASTFIAGHDPARIYRFISSYLSPAEVLLLIAFAIGLLHEVPAILPLLAIYLVLDWLGSQRHSAGSKKAQRYRRRYRMNDFRARWLPLMALVQLTLVQWHFIIWLICYPVIFPQAVPAITTRIDRAIRFAKQRLTRISQPSIIHARPEP
ncbi:MAG: UbiA family prenyltransferase [Phycisphaerae bacterium]|nr:UbiA family prenyltransferase [Phycisphaerae bacterium]